MWSGGRSVGQKYLFLCPTRAQASLAPTASIKSTELVAQAKPGNKGAVALWTLLTQVGKHASGFLYSFSQSVCMQRWERNYLLHYNMGSVGAQSIALLHRTTLLDGDFCADLRHFGSDLLSLFFGDAFFDGLGCLVNNGFRFFQTQTSEFAHNFNDVDLVRTNIGEYGVELGLLFNGCRSGGFSSRCCRTCSRRSYGSCAYAP